MKRAIAVSDDTNISVRQIGEGEPVVLLHAWAMAAEAYEELAAALARTYSVVTMDFRGHGESSDAPAGYDIETLADDVIHVLDALSVQSCTLLGWSMGTSVATIVAARRPDLVARLVLVGAATPLLTERPDFPAAAPASLVELLEEMEQTDSAAMRKMVVDTLTFAPMDARNQSIIANATARPDGSALMSLTRSMADSDLRQMLVGLGQPILVMHGKEDAFAPFAKAEWIADQARNARLVPFSDCGHAPFLEHKARFLDELRAFLADRANADTSTANG